MKKFPLASIIVANFNGEQFLEICLNSIMKTHYRNYEIIIIDDGSVDSSDKIIKTYQKKSKKIVYLKNKKNIGAAASRNRAIKIVKGDIIVFLDNDTEVDPLWLTAIVNSLKKEDVGACQSLLIDYKDRKKIQMAGAKLWALTGWGLPISQWKNSSLRFSRDIPVIAISAALAVKKHVLNVVGEFDESEAIVTEDLDFSWRIWIAGYRIVLSPNSRVFHWTKSLSMRKNMAHSKQQIYYHLTKNSLISMIKNYELSSLVRFLPLCILIFFGRAYLVLLKRKNIDCLQGTILGIFWVLTHIPEILRKRFIIQQKRGYSDSRLFGTILDTSSIRSVYQLYFTQTQLL